MRVPLRVVSCCRRDILAGSELVQHLGNAIVGSLPVKEGIRLVGETLLITGCQAEESTFPHGFFKDWVLNKDAGGFARC